jgi:hypothetical protein
MAANRDAAWLLKRQAVSVLPSVASLKALRRFARKDQGTKPMIGFGDPLFDAMQDGAGERCAAAGFRPRPVVLLRRPAVWGPFALIGQGGGPISRECAPQHWRYEGQFTKIAALGRVLDGDGFSRNVPTRSALQQVWINDPPENKPNTKGSAWQFRRSSVLGFRTEAGRLY